MGLWIQNFKVVCVKLSAYKSNLVLFKKKKNLFGLHITRFSKNVALNSRCHGTMLFVVVSVQWLFYVSLSSYFWWLFLLLSCLHLHLVSLLCDYPPRPREFHLRPVSCACKWSCLSLFICPTVAPQSLCVLLDSWFFFSQCPAEVNSFLWVVFIFR